MLFHQSLNKYWRYLESKYSKPIYVSRVKTLKFDDLKKAIDNKNIKSNFLYNFKSSLVTIFSTSNLVILGPNFF